MSEYLDASLIGRIGIVECLLIPTHTMAGDYRLRLGRLLLFLLALSWTEAFYIPGTSDRKHPPTVIFADSGA